jgi:hypothetical protein
MSRKGCLIWLMMMMTVTVMVLKAMKKMLIKMMERGKKERGRKKNWKGLRCSRVRGTCYLIHKNLGGHHFRCESSQFCKYECLQKAHEECISNASLVSTAHEECNASLVSTNAWHYIPGSTPDIPAAQIEKMMADRCPLGRCALPEDVARVVAFLCSEDGGWVNGQVITISGGSSQ